LYNNTPAMLHSVDPDGRLVSVSEHWLDVMGYERNEVLGISCDSIFYRMQHGDTVRSSPRIGCRDSEPL
ncbi:MAG: PAS domain-containing protein, partial [Alphaproteobacteria bacterium]|nr:PAS domain-containing protein [Alphaproteobacteria bacterium]